MKYKSLCVVSATSVLAACASEPAVDSGDISQALAVIQPDLIRSHLAFLSDDRLRG